MLLGTWQGIYVVEHRDRPHRREVVLHYLGTRDRRLDRGLGAGELARRGNELVDDAGLAHGVAGVGHDAQIRARPAPSSGPTRS